MKKYLWGFLRYLLHTKVSKTALVTGDSQISPKAVVYCLARVCKSSIGDYSYVGPKSRVVCAEIGKFCSIAGEGNIGMSSHTLSYISTSPIFTERRNGTKSSWVAKNTNEAKTKRCIIGNDVWIGTKVIIKDGITIGDGAVIGAGAVVTHDIPPFAIVAGVPAKVIRYRFEPKVVESLLDIKWWEWPDSVLRQNLNLFQSENIDIQTLKTIQKGNLF